MAPPKPTRREVPMKLINLGLCRTGTTSTRHALLQLGYQNVHTMMTVGHDAPWEPAMWVEATEAKFGGKGKPYGREEFDIMLSRYDAVVDIPAAAFPEELMLAYPDAKLMLTVRDTPEAWTRSMADTLWQFKRLLLTSDPATRLIALMTPLESAVSVPMIMFGYDIVGGLEKSDDFNRKAYVDHNENVKQLAKKYGRELLIFNCKEGWGPLCAFLGKDVPDGPFPRVNETADMKKIIKKVKFMQRVVQTIIYGFSASAVAWVAWRVAAKRGLV